MNLKQADLGVSGVYDEDQLQTKVIRIKVKHFNGLKLTVAIVICLAMGLMYSVKELEATADLKTKENLRLQSQIAALKEQVGASNEKLDAISASSDSSNNKALGYIESIQSKLKKINDYLGKRGLRGISFHTINVAKKNSSKKQDNLKLYAKYNNYLEEFVTNVAMVPMGYPRVSSFTSFFGYRSNPFDFGGGEFHPGIDFKGNTGDPVKCTASGRVVFTGRAGGYGNCIRIQHMGNVQTWYGHLSKILVHEGQRVTVGEVIGKVGSTGRSTGPHLHYEVRRNGKPVNPKQYLTLNQ
ncbi:M23 family metallopeptidase [Mucilaginibacter sp. KACC 22063]|uniref:M23 family metallopeptidase n=1 Tax=Mucilaginibacter sp. KACC 22063 TaxID=3025666 RepID=UPI002365D70F|nr:peptidoglycan DD-metalloendopeptidase family protein [Mucilaginibacter sp. KACC 22063]WDF54953.1 peptidoglycan DD-metalloendopeptidase family protein [Mucilaginibacter sp. KACC 22063]